MAFDREKRSDSPRDAADAEEKKFAYIVQIKTL